MIKIKLNLLKLILMLQIVFIGVFVLSKLEINIPLLRQFIGLMYLFLVPGTLLMFIFGLNNMSSLLDFCLYSFGLSFSVIMVIGFMLNFLGHIFIAKPISSLSLFITFTIFFMILYIFCIFQKKFESSITFSLNGNHILYIIIFFFLPILAVLGGYLVHYKSNNLLLLIYLVIVALVAFSPLSNKLRFLYPYIIFLTSLSLIYHIVLSVPYSLGGDAYLEYGYTKLVVLNGIWKPSSILVNDNAMLSLNILFPVFCRLCGMSVIQSYKLVFPLILSLIPLGLYSILRRQIEPELAFISSYFYLSIRPFYMWISNFIKQGTAMFFLMLIVLVLVDGQILKKINGRILLMLFSFSLITSHYGTSYVFMLLLITAVCVYILQAKKFVDYLVYYPFLYIILAITWYMYISQGSAFDTILNIGSQVISNIYTLFNPEAAGGLHVLVYTPLVLSYKILKMLYLVVNFFIVFGFLVESYSILTQNGKNYFTSGFYYYYFSFPSFGLLVMSVVIPHLIGRHSMGFQRIYTIVLFFLAPFCVIGFIKFLEIIKKVQFVRELNILKIITVFFAIFLLFNSGWVTEITKEYVGSIAISQARIKCCGTIREKAAFYNTYFTEEDVFSAVWFSKYRINMKISSDFYATRVLNSWGMTVGRGDPSGYALLTPKTIRKIVKIKDTYIYLRELNWRYNIMTKPVYEKNWLWNTSKIKYILASINRIYSNGGSVIFLT